MAADHDVEEEDAVLANGDTLDERLEKLDIDPEETSSVAELREKLELE